MRHRAVFLAAWTLVPALAFAATRESAPGIEAVKAQLMKTDSDYSDAAQKSGIAEAFVRYADAGATMLLAGENPVMGPDGVRRQFTYCSVWKRQKDGAWMWVMDVGTPSPGPWKPEAPKP